MYNIEELGGFKMENSVVFKLMEKQYHIAFAESCTGGLCAAKLVSVPSASSVLNASFVTYAEEAKMKYLNVKRETIDKYNVVSENVAYEMALGVAKETNSEVGVGVTGVAGPTGGTLDIPVGTVCFGFSILGKVTTETVHFGDIGRNNVRKKACEYVFKRLNELL